MLYPSARHKNSPKYWLIPRKQWLCPDMTKKLLTGTLNLNTNKPKSISFQHLIRKHSYMGHRYQGFDLYFHANNAIGLWYQYPGMGLQVEI